MPNFGKGRWHKEGDGLVVQYLSMHPMTPWAELLRNANRRTEEEARRLRPPLWTVTVQLEQEPFELNWETVRDYGCEPGDLVSDDRSVCQALARQLNDDGVEAFTAPSAALPGTRNLLVLRPLVVIDFHLDPYDDDTPTALLAQNGRCPDGLWNLVHYEDSATPHPELDAWINGDEFEFVQPAVTEDSLAVAAEDL